MPCCRFDHDCCRFGLFCFDSSLFRPVSVRFHICRFEPWPCRPWAISFTPLCLCLSEDTLRHSIKIHPPYCYMGNSAKWSTYLTIIFFILVYINRVPFQNICIKGKYDGRIISLDVLYHYKIFDVKDSGIEYATF